VEVGKRDSVHAKNGSKINVGQLLNVAQRWSRAYRYDGVVLSGD